MEESAGPAADAAAKDREAGATAPGRVSFWRRRGVVVVGSLLLGAGLLLGLPYLFEGFTHESTDDAFLDAHIISIAPKVAGQVAKVSVTENQAVWAGDLLVELDPRDLQVVLEQKRAAVASAEANTDLIKSTVELFRSQIAAAEATAKQSAAEVGASQAKAERAAADLKRAQDLITNHTISPQEFDTAKAEAASAEADLRAAREKAVSDGSKVAQAQALVYSSLQTQATLWGFVESFRLFGGLCLLCLALILLFKRVEGRSGTSGSAH